jgi:hypothetical protein
VTTGYTKNQVEMKVKLTKEEVSSLKKFCDEKLTKGSVVINQQFTGIGNITNVMIDDKPDTVTDITDYSNW